MKGRLSHAPNPLGSGSMTRAILDLCIMRTKQPAALLLRYGLADISVGIAAFFTHLLKGYGDAGVSPLFFAAVMLGSAWYGGNPGPVFSRPYCPGWQLPGCCLRRGDGHFMRFKRRSCGCWSVYRRVDSHRFASRARIQRVRPMRRARRGKPPRAPRPRRAGSWRWSVMNCGRR